MKMKPDETIGNTSELCSKTTICSVEKYFVHISQFNEKKKSPSFVLFFNSWHNCITLIIYHSLLTYINFYLRLYRFEGHEVIGDTQ